MMESRTAPSAAEAPAWLPIRRYDLALQRDARWQDAGGGVEQRDLGLGGASEGAMQGRQLRAARQADLPEALRQAGTHFHLFYVVQGQLTLEGPDDVRTVLQAGDCIHQPALGRQHRITLSEGAEVLELAVPAKPTLAGKELELESSQQAAQPVINRDRPEAYIQGDGPRSYFLYRDLGVAAATGRRVHIHILKATAPSAPGGTGAHKHSMCQLFYVFRGWADLEVEGHESVRMHGGDAMCISAGTRHNVPAFSPDYAILELCIPADYDTVGT
ncbi:cupin domain-containing protein [Xenophilus azovorans]|uniref:cupin domain-containing protein n=1 Tax=Xenophilus azovorans TaxID=151755 RepID=UPI000A05672F|nr:cupin domain-containing protein [Xenophilus azovorans]